MLCSLLSPVMVYAAQLEPYTDTANRDFKLPALNGKTHSLSDFKGKVVLVNFWASWCIPCVQELPELVQLKNQMADQPLEIIALNTGESKYDVEKFNRRYKINLPVLLDTHRKVFNSWNVKLLPTSFLLDRAGHIRYQVLGNPGWDKEQTIKVIQKLINETLIND